MPAICTALILCAVPESIEAQSPPSELQSGALTYSAAWEIASSRNLKLAAARRQRAAREAAIVTAGLRPNPDFTAEVSRDTPHEVIGVDWPLEIGGQRSRRLDLAKEELLLSEVDVQTALRALRRELREAFYSLMFADEHVRLSQSLLDIARQLRDGAQARVDTGAAPRLEVLQADLAVARADADVAAAVSLRRADQARLNGILDWPPDRSVTLDGSLSDGVTEMTIDAANSLARAQNPELLGLDRQIAVEQRRIDLLTAERTPTPTVTVGGVFDAPGEFAAGWRAGVSVGLPLFNRNQGEIAASIATSAQLRAERDAVARTVENGVYAALQTMTARNDQLTTFQQRLIPTATELATLSDESYRSGRTALFTVFEAQRSVRELSEEALQAALDVQLAVADLEDVIGAPLP
jgi:cobalt-zinc-cadmium efflux system outer membrane protein